MMIQTIAMMAPGGEGAPQQSPVFMVGWLILMVGVFYMFLIRPQQRREKDRRAMIGNAKTGDRIVFGGGILGTISNVKEKTLMVKIADTVKVEIVKHAVSQVLERGAEPSDEPAR